MSQNNYKTVGIIGGMGPEATVELMRLVIELTPADDDQDHIRMLVDNNPKVPSRMKAIIDGSGESPLPELIKMAQGLEKSGAEFLVMPCHTAHYYYDGIAESVSIPFINLIELTASTINILSPDIKKVGVLASTAVKNTKLYDNAFADLNIDVVFPEPKPQEKVMQIIKNVKGKNLNLDSLDDFSHAGQYLNRQGAECLVIACTELSVIADKLDSPIPVFDALEILADEIINIAKG